MKLKPFTPHRYRRRLFGQLWSLALQFLLGMILNFIGSDTHGASHAFYVGVLVVHILNAVGLVEGAIYIALKAPSRLAWWASGVTVAALAAGVLTSMTGQDGWSFVMACGFIASAWLHVILYVQADRAVQSES